jgi:hypothetical protein
VFWVFAHALAAALWCEFSDAALEVFCRAVDERDPNFTAGRVPSSGKGGGLVGHSCSSRGQGHAASSSLH